MMMWRIYIYILEKIKTLKKLERCMDLTMENVQERGIDNIYPFNVAFPLPPQSSHTVVIRIICPLKWLPVCAPAMLLMLDYR